MKILGFDTETTGLDPATGDKIIEVALLTYDSDSRQIIDSYIQRIDPERSISPKAQEVHGIMYEELVGQPKFCDIASIIHGHFERADAFVAHNITFDAAFILYEFAAVGLKIPDRLLFDTMEEARFATPNGKYPRLEELCFAFDVPYDKAAAHAAQYDVERMMECFWKGLDQGFYKITGLGGKT